MECDACGRYRPSPEITASRGADGRLVMICTRCRGLERGHGEPARPAPEAPATPTEAAVLVLAR